MQTKITAALAVVFLLSSSAHLFGQSATGNIIGHITDASGAVVAEVNVTATNPHASLRLGKGTFRDKNPPQ